MVEDLSVLNNVAEIWLINKEGIPQEEVDVLIADLTQLLSEIYDAGYGEGYNEGYSDGYDKGLEENLTELQW